MSKKKSKPCSYYSGVESWKTKKRQKKDIDRKKEAEAFEVLELDNTLDKLVEATKEVTESIKRMVSEMVENEKGEQE